MSDQKVVLITGAAGNLGAKLRRHLEGRHPLRLIDRDPRGDSSVLAADLARWEGRWVDLFRGVDTVFHLAADPTAQQAWPNVIGPNIDAVVNVFEAAVTAGVRRVVYASSNHVMGGYKDEPEPFLLTTDLPPRPGTRYVVEGEPRDSTPYAAAKLFGERLGKCIAEAHGLSVLAVRIGWVRPGENRAADIPPGRGEWFRMMWLSDRDFCHLMDCCLDANPALRFALLYGMSANTGMRWGLESTRRLVGYRPRDDVTRSITAETARGADKTE
jgi:nucleoside-diphosphate-sugar epimerase